MPLTCLTQPAPGPRHLSADGLRDSLRKLNAKPGSATISPSRGRMPCLCSVYVDTTHAHHLWFAIIHTLSTVLPALHSRGSAAYSYTPRKYYCTLSRLSVRVTASVSQVHVRYIELDSRKKNALGSREDVAGPWNAQTSRVLYARDFENEINDLGSWVSEDVATSSNPSSIHPSIHSLLLTD